MFGIDDAVLGGAIGGVLDIFGQTRANRDNKDMAYQQMNFQRDMSSSAYQRAVADMQAAGLNPMLAYSQGGASSPSGASSHSVPVEYGRAITGGMQAKQLAAQTENIEAQADLSRAQAVKAAADTRATLASAGQIERTVDNIVRQRQYAADQDEEDWNYRRPRALAETYGYKMRANELDRDDAFSRRYLAPEGFLDIEQREALARMLLQENAVPGSRNEREVDESDYGKERPYIRDAGAIAGGAASAAGAAVLLRNLFRKPRVIGGARQGPSHKGSWRNGRESRMDELEGRFQDESRGIYFGNRDGKGGWQ